MLTVHLDLTDLYKLANLREKVDSIAKEELKNLSAMTYSHLVGQVQNKLHSSREMYLEALSISQLDDEIWLINLDAKMLWVEEGTKRHSMVEDLLKSPKAKRSKSGTLYAHIPFKHNTKPSSSTPAQNTLIDTIKSEFKRHNIQYGGIEKDQQGNAKKGLLHSIDITNSPLKTAEGIGQGHGAIGQVKQGHTGIPFLKGIKVYQRDVKTNSGTKTQKDIMTFRTVSSKDIGSNKWIYPEKEGKKFFEDAETWANQQLDKIKEQILAKVS